MDRSDSPAVEQIVARFFEQRAKGNRVSIDDVLSASIVDGDRRQTRDAALRIVTDRLRSSRVSLQGAEVSAAMAGSEPALPDLEGYDLIDELGRGGMGIVYEAYQRSTGRRVAVKVMSELAAASESGRRRFEREVELVARLQHPGIVAIVDSGVNRGRFFFVMEYVEGQPLDRALSSEPGDMRRALSVLAEVADAVDYAHQRGVLHRDLKPSNILVDAAGKPHVLDFGLAKAIDPGSSVSRGLTQDGPNRLLGTLAYMSPEQSRGELTTLSVRSDVYSLGAMGYELATGRLPCDVDGPLQEVLTRIATADPPPPSTLRRTDRSSSLVSGDIDAILLKALEKDPQLRYATAGELAADVRRFLADEPIAARPISAWYQFRKFARRNRALVGGVAAAALLLIVGAAGTTWQAVRATRAERRAVAERDRALKAADRATQVTRFVQRMLALARPSQAKGRETSVRDILDRASKAIEAGLPLQPQTTAALRYTIGMSYLQLGSFDQADPHLQAALTEQRQHTGESDVELFDTLLALAQLRMEQNRADESEKLINEAAQLPGMAGAAAGKPYELLSRLAVFQTRKGNIADAVRLFREALHQIESAKQPDDSLIAGATMNLAGALEDANDRTTAEKLYQQAIDRFRRAGGDDSPDVALASYNLAICLHNQDRLKEAEPLYREALRIRRKVLPATHPELGETMASLGGVLREDGRPVEAEPLLRESLDIFRSSLPAGHPNIAKSEGFLGQCLNEMQRFDDAEPLFRSAILSLEKSQGPDDRWTQQMIKGLVVALDGQKKQDEAAKYRARLKVQAESAPAK